MLVDVVYKTAMPASAVLMLTCEKLLCLPVLALALALAHKRALSHKQPPALVLTLANALAASLPMALAIAVLRLSPALHNHTAVELSCMLL